jgi:radical SAM superfamily enzyme
MPLTAHTKTVINNAIAAAQPRRLAAEFLAHCIITNPDDYPEDMLAAARVILAPVKLQGVGA